MDFPALFQAADAASTKEQHKYLFLVGGNLLLLVATAVSSGISLSGTSHRVTVEKLTVAFVTTVLLIISTFLTYFVQTAGSERYWLDGRAIAESVKTLTWRYVTCANPYSKSLDMADLDRNFTSDLYNLLAERKSLAPLLGGDAGVKPQVTTAMRQARELDTSGRMKLYLEQRIANQQKWYSQKADANRTYAHGWLWMVMLCQLTAVVFAVVAVIMPGTHFNVTAVLVTVASASLAWLQLKQYQELAQSYGLAAQELGMIASQGGHISKEDELSAFTLDAENAISREHTLWLARKDQNSSSLHP